LQVLVASLQGLEDWARDRETRTLENCKRAAPALLRMASSSPSPDGNFQTESLRNRKGPNFRSALFRFGGKQAGRLKTCASG
jgi:hypothetical protein